MERHAACKAAEAEPALHFESRAFEPEARLFASQRLGDLELEAP